MNNTKPGAMKRLLDKACDIHPEEVRATLASFSLVLVLMGAYYILRPLRDAMASDWTDAEVSWLWTFTFFFSAAAVSLYGVAVTRIRLQRLVPTVYSFFALSFVAFYIGTQTFDQRTLLDKSFYIWVSVFSLFHISVFWTFMADTYSRPQAKRLFGFIGAGASIGAMIGPTIATHCWQGWRRYRPTAADRRGPGNVLTCRSFTCCRPSSATDLHNEAVAAGAGDFEYIGGNPLAGFTEFFKNPYLLGIGLFIFLYTAISSFVYFELKNLLADYDRETRTQIWAAMDLVVNTLTVLIAAFATGRMAKHLGLPFTLASVPVLPLGRGYCCWRRLPWCRWWWRSRSRAGPATTRYRDRLGRCCSRRWTGETRFKAKPVIDIVIYRGGDMLNAWAFTALTQGLGLGLAAVAVVGAGVAAVWAATGIYLGRRFNRTELAQTPPGVTDAT